jgi:F-type H+-transporting ATPase subunit gamma
VSHGREVRRHLEALGELKSILGAMRTLALVEIGKLGRIASAQRQMVLVIERAAADFFAFAPAPPPGATPRRGLVVFGSERGFCGGFNEALAAALAGDATSTLVLVGQRLAARVPEGRPSRVLPGATAAEELPGLVARLAAAMSGAGEHDWTLVHHDPDTRALRRVNPLAVLHSRRAPLGPFAPRIYSPPSQVAQELVEQYLPALLLEVASSSFMAENRERLRHMEGALDRLEDDLRSEGRRLSAFRQEEITEEIEILLLGAEGGAKRAR